MLSRTLNLDTYLYLMILSEPYLLFRFYMEDATVLVLQDIQKVNFLVTFFHLLLSFSSLDHKLQIHQAISTNKETKKKRRRKASEKIARQSGGK